MSVTLLTLVVLTLAAVGALPATKEAQCGYQSCPPPLAGKLNVHLVPHSHDDVGWLKTIDQYFYGSRSDIKQAGVQYILDSVVKELQLDPARRFIYVETAFFWQWWLEQTEEVRAQVRGLVDSGQLEFISGAWSMNDEAVTHYQSTVDQFTWGLRKLNDTFGSCARPHIGWQIDPFGHSRETASLMAQMGFDGLFFARLDADDKTERMKQRTLEHVWQASANLGESSWLFTSALYFFYKAPPGFCFDILCTDDPIIDNQRSPDYNVDQRVDEFIAYAEEQSQFYATEHVIIAMGQDFSYQQADMWYKNLDKLIEYVNARQEGGSRVNLLYSTPSCYLKALHEAGRTWSTKTDDFFPYSNDANSYWTGYFTSRPTLKFFERKGNNLLQVCKQLSALAGLVEDDWEDLSSLREVMGVMQHHDAITGTEKQHVAEDYALRLDQAFADCHNTTETAVNKLMAVDASSPYVRMSPCLLSNVSQCEVSETSERFVVTLYNPLARPSAQFVRLPVPDNNFKVVDPAGEEVPVQLVPIPAPVQNIPGRTSTAQQELVFKAADLPPLGFKSYYVEKLSAQMTPTKPVEDSRKFTIGNKRGVRAELDAATGRLRSLAVGKLEVELQQTFLYYEGAEGDNSAPQNRASGAYVFRPASQDATLVNDAVQVETFEGPVVTETHQIFSDWVSQVIRSYEGEDYLEFEWLVGPIPVEDEVGKEVISRFATDWPTEGLFYTDSNGREMLERRRDFRSTWPANILEPVSGNYYPVTTAISIKNSSSELLVLTDRAQGGGSIRDGEIEIMVHRRLLHDDDYGVYEALNETAFGEGQVARGRHLVVLGSRTASPTAAAQQRQLSMRQMVLAPWTLLAPTELTFQEWAATYKTQYSALKTALPENVHLLTLEPWKDDSLLLRLENFYELSDDPILSVDATVTLEDLFETIPVTSARETTLGGNQWLEENARLEWGVAGAEGGAQQLQRPGQSAPDAGSRLAVQLVPMQIRTFVLNPAVTQSAATANVAVLSLCLALVAVLLLV